MDIPAGGLFTGAEGIMTADEAAVPEWGGVAGEQYDQCYHAVCDTLDNVNLFALDTNSDAIAYVTLSYAMNTEEINGIQGKGNFRFQQQDEEVAGRGIVHRFSPRERAPIGALSLRLV